MAGRVAGSTSAQHNVTMWRWLIAATFISEMKRENGTTTITEMTANRRW
jgi:hypothetical protein